MDLETYEQLGLHQTFAERHSRSSINGRNNGEIADALATPGDIIYHPCPEATPVDAAPTGTVTKYADWSESAIFPNTIRDVWIYQPAQLDETEEAPGVFVFNDGAAYLHRAGPVRTTHVLDTLIHRGELPAAVAVFVMPGRAPGVPEAPTDAPPDPRAMAQRSFEYDSLTDLYARFLEDELLAFVESTLGRPLSRAPSANLLCGISSGGICAFTAAWHRPERFGRVLSHCGSFTQIRGGHHYPYLIRSTPRKPIRVFMTSGKLDANIILGNWPLANQLVADSLDYAGYDYRFEFGEGGHNLRHGGALFAESLRWLFRAPQEHEDG